MTSTNIQDLVEPWTIGAITAQEVIQGNVFRLMCEGGEQYVLKNIGERTAEKISRLEFERDVLSHVEAQGLPVAVPLLARDGLPYSLVSGEIYRLSRWLPNTPAEPRTPAEKDHLYRSYGRAIARFHDALASYTDEVMLRRTWTTTLHKRVFVEAVPSIQKNTAPEQLPAFAQLLGEVEADMRTAFTDLPLQPIIWDCHGGNVAVDGLDVTGFVDCDLIAVAPKVMDLGDFLVHLIKWDIGNPAKEAEWLAHAGQVLAGYERIVKLSVQERRAVFYAMLGQPLIFMDYFYQTNNVEPIAHEWRLFEWLVRRRADIIARMDG